jgi:membrane-bound metal-dependent hydrolase YbcI (DUF457 family)
VFIGHFALGFAAKRLVPRVSLAVLFAAAQLADMLWPAFLALGLEQVRIDPGNTAMTPLDFVSYPYSHSLLFLVVWGVLLAWLYRLIAGNGHIFEVLAALVVSHWVLDVVTHRPDMPLYPGGAKLGLSLWSSIPATVAVETAMFAAGVWIYARTTRAKNAVGRWGLVGMVALLGFGYVGAAGGPPPPSVNALMIVSFAGAALGLLLSWWVDRHREPRNSKFKMQNSK